MEALLEVENNDLRAIQEAVTAPEPEIESQTEPVVNVVSPANIQEETLLSRLIGWLPFIGLVLVGLLIGAYLVIRRRQSLNDSHDIAVFDEEYDEDAPVYAQIDEDADQTEEMPLEDDLEDFVLGDQDTSDNEMPEADATHELEEEDSLESDINVSEEPAEPSSDEEDWNSDFDDLDAFFDDVGDSVSTKNLAATKAQPEQVAEIMPEVSELEVAESNADQPEEESESADDSLMDFESTNFEEENSTEQPEPVHEDDEESDGSALDFSLDEDNLSSEDVSVDTPLDSADSEHDEKFAVDFDLDDSDLKPKDSVSDTESENLDLSEDEDTLSFDISDMDISDKAPAVELTDQATSELESEAETETSDTISIDPADEDLDLDSLLGGLDSELDDLSALASEDDVSAEVETDDLGADFDIDLSEGLEDGEDSDLSSLLGEPVETSENKEAESLQADNSDLLDDFDDDELDLSDFDAGNNSAADMAEECEIKMELAAAYIEMGDSSGAKELLEEVISEGDDSYKAKANNLLKDLGE